MTPPSLVVFCDFDGTVSEKDIGYQLFRHFSGGRNDALLPDWKSGRLSTRDCLMQEAAMVSASVEELTAFIGGFHLDPTFADFEAVCRQQGIPVIIISEGLHWYISAVLERHGLGHLPVISNHGFPENNGIRIEFPHANRDCRRCGSCKGERIQEYRETIAPNARVVFIGDGYSDACAAKVADILFAKKDLVHYCQSQNIPYTSFTTFTDVTRTLVAQELVRMQTDDHKMGNAQ